MKALRVIKSNDVIGCVIESLPVPLPGPGEIVIKAAYSSVNYKDALAAIGAGKIMKSLPMTGGIDVAGTVADSQDARFVVGQAVLVTGYGLGVEIDGGYAEYVRVPADWVVPLPDGLTALQAMALGTAGFTAALAVTRMQDNGLRPDAGPVAVTGATGGVGSLALAMLAQLGYETVAITGKLDQTEYLTRLGAARVLDRRSLEMGTRPLEKSLWAGAVDSVGGATLAWLTRTLAYRGVIAACGLAGGIELSTTVMPFILRGVSLIGIDSVQCPMAQRLDIWTRLAGELRPRSLESDIARIIDFEDLPGVFQDFLDAGVSGRTVVRLP
ncbi:MAG: YhdH/YhfP family quinone oxidoreductase [Pseudomonadota bacterium]